MAHQCNFIIQPLNEGSSAEAHILDKCETESQHMSIIVDWLRQCCLEQIDGRRERLLRVNQVT